GAVSQIRHVFFRQKAADDALVSVTSGHLVTNLQLALNGDVDLDHLDDAWRQFIAAAKTLDLVAEVLLTSVDHILQIVEKLSDFVGVTINGDLTPILAGNTIKHCACEGSALFKQGRPVVVDQLSGRRFAGKCTTKTMVEAVTDDFDLFVAGSLKFRPLFALDGLS